MSSAGAFASLEDSRSFRMIKCLGCKRQFGDFAEYNAHDCPQPSSGEAYR